MYETIVEKYRTVLLMELLKFFCDKFTYRQGTSHLAQIPGARLPMQLNFMLWCIIFLDPQYGTCFISPSWYKDF
jgi:hypothetical protein